MKKTLLILSMACLSANAAETITFALAGPTTGPVTQYGTMQNTGAMAAIKDINAQGGINGKQIVAKIYDDACESKQAVTVANQIANDDVKFVIGHLCSSSTVPAAAIYNEEGILMVTAASTLVDLTQKGYETIFRTIGTDLQSAPVAAKYIIEELKPKKIALLHDKQQYGQGLAEGVKEALEKAGVEIAIFEGVNQGQTDFSALITKLKKAEIDLVYWGGFHPEVGLIVRQGADQGFKPTYIGADGVDNPDLFSIAGDAAEGFLATVPVKFDELPENKAIVDAILAEKGDPRGPFVMPAYAAVKVIADAAKIANSDDPEKIAEVLRNNEFETPIGKISFEKNGDLKNFKSVIYQLHADGTRTQKTN